MRAITCSTPSKRPIGVIELAANAGVGAGGEDRGQCAAGGVGRQ
jgi:hypothetical protein